MYRLLKVFLCCLLGESNGGEKTAPPRHISGRLRSKVISASFLQITRKNRQMMTLTTSGVNHHFVTYTNDEDNV